MNKCLVCKKEIPFDTRQLWLPNGTSICMGCEFKEITAYHVTLPGEKNGYYDTEIKHIVDTLSECGYTVKKEKMKATTYYSLPEFAGF